MLVKIIAPNGEFKREGNVSNIREKDRDLYLNFSSIGSIHVVENRLYFDRLRLTFESSSAAQNAITVLSEAIANNSAVVEIAQGVVTVIALRGCTISMNNGESTETDNGPIMPESTDIAETCEDAEEEIGEEEIGEEPVEHKTTTEPVTEEL